MSSSVSTGTALPHLLIFFNFITTLCISTVYYLKQYTRSSKKFPELWYSTVMVGHTTTLTQSPSKYDPCAHTHFPHRSCHCWEHRRKSSFGIFRSSAVAFDFMSSMVAKRAPLRPIFRVGNSQKSPGARSGEYGGWVMTGMLFSATGRVSQPWRTSKRMRRLNSGRFQKKPSSGTSNNGRIDGGSVCVCTRVLLWRWLGKRCHVVCHTTRVLYHNSGNFLTALHVTRTATSQEIVSFCHIETNHTNFPAGSDSITSVL